MIFQSDSKQSRSDDSFRTDSSGGSEIQEGQDERESLLAAMDRFQKDVLDANVHVRDQAITANVPASQFSQFVGTKLHMHPEDSLRVSSNGNKVAREAILKLHGGLIPGTTKRVAVQQVLSIKTADNLDASVEQKIRFIESLWDRAKQGELIQYFIENPNDAGWISFALDDQALANKGTLTEEAKQVMQNLRFLPSPMASPEMRGTISRELGPYEYQGEFENNFRPMQRQEAVSSDVQNLALKLMKNWGKLDEPKDYGITSVEQFERLCKAFQLIRRQDSTLADHMLEKIRFFNNLKSGNWSDVESLHQKLNSQPEPVVPQLLNDRQLVDGIAQKLASRLEREEQMTFAIRSPQQMNRFLNALSLLDENQREEISKKMSIHLDPEKLSAEQIQQCRRLYDVASSYASFELPPVSAEKNEVTSVDRANEREQGNAWVRKAREALGKIRPSRWFKSRAAA